MTKQTRLRFPETYYAFDYGARELAGSQVAQQHVLATLRATGANLGGVLSGRFHLVSTNKIFDAVAQAHWFERLGQQLDLSEVREGGVIAVGSTDQRAADGRKPRNANEGGRILATFDPKRNFFALLADAANAAALHAQDAQRRGLPVFLIPIRTRHQFRGAYVLPELAQQLNEQIQTSGVRSSGDLTQLRNPHGGLITQLSAEEVAELASFAGAVRDAQHGGVSEYFDSQLTSNPYAPPVAILITDYAHDPEFAQRARLLAANVIPADLNRADEVDAGFQLAVLGTQSPYPTLVAVDLDGASWRDTWAAPLPGGSLAIGPASADIWTELHHAGYPVVAAGSFSSAADAAGSLWGARQLPGHRVSTTDIGPPQRNRAKHPDTFGQVKFFGNEAVEQAFVAAQRAVADSNGARASAVIASSRISVTSAIGTGIFGVASGDLVLAKGSSQIVLAEPGAGAITALEVAERDGSAADALKLDEGNVGRRRAGEELSVEIVRSLAPELNGQGARTLNGAAAPVAVGLA